MVVELCLHAGQVARKGVKCRAEVSGARFQKGRRRRVLSRGVRFGQTWRREVGDGEDYGVVEVMKNEAPLTKATCCGLSERDGGQPCRVGQGGSGRDREWTKSSAACFQMEGSGLW